MAIVPSTKRPTLRIASAGLVGAMLVSGVATAAPAEREPVTSENDATEASLDPAARARAAYERGSAAYADARFAEALLHFQEASALVASPDFLFNIGLCHEELENYDDAVRAFSAYLAAKPDAADAAAVRARVGRLRRALETRSAVASDTRVPNGSGPAIPPPEDDPADTSGVRSRSAEGGATALLAVGASALVAGAAVAAGGIAPSLAGARHRAAIDRVNAGNPDALTATEVRRLQADTRTARIQQIALLSTGGALVAIGAVLTAVGALRKRGRRISHLGLGVAPGSAGVRWRGRF